MKKYLPAVLLVLVSTVALGMAQTKTAVIADVPFAFLVGNQSLPAGTYEFSAGDNLEVINVTNTKGKDSALTAVITRLGKRSDNEASVIFDVAGTNHYLSEIFVPGLDGFLVKGAPSKHTHISIKGNKK